MGPPPAYIRTIIITYIGRVVPLAYSLLILMVYNPN
nr:MAG TPA: hypothetical protein [Caudoviricetes sp.]